MTDTDNIFLFEQNEEAVQAVKAGRAKIGSGGIRRLDGTFLNMAKPATLSVSDLQSLFKNDELSTKMGEYSSNIVSHLSASGEVIKHIEEYEWLNNSLIQRTYVMNYEGFQSTIDCLDRVRSDIFKLKEYIRQRDINDMLERTQLYRSNLITDFSNLESPKYDAINSNIAEHLNQISAFLNRLLQDIIQNNDNAFIALQIVGSLVVPYSVLVRRFSAVIYYENGHLPGNYTEWVNTLLKTTYRGEMLNKTMYYMGVKTTLPFKERLRVAANQNTRLYRIIFGVQFDEKYIRSHKKEEYIGLSKQIQNKLITRDYYEYNGNKCIFLD